MFGLILPPGVTLLKKDLVPDNYEATSIMYKVVCCSVIKQLKFLEEAQFSPSKECALAYFQSWGLDPYNESERDIAVKQLICHHTPQLQQTFEKGRSDKLRLLALSLRGILKRYYVTIEHQSVLRRLVDHGLGWEAPGWDSNIRAILIDATMKVSQRDNKDIEDDWMPNNDDSLESLAVVYKEELISYLDTIISLCETCHGGKKLTDGNIMGMTILAMCVIPRWYRLEPLTLRDYKKIETSVMWPSPDTYSSFREQDEDIDVDPTTIMMINIFHEAVKNHRYLKNRLLRPGYQCLLEWMVIERYILSNKFQNLHSDTACDDDYPTPVRATRGDSRHDIY